jgi:hypothetical protein
MIETTSTASTEGCRETAGGPSAFDPGTLECLGRMIDTFVMATVETLCAADAVAPSLRDSASHRRRVAKVMADIEEVEASVVRLRAMWAVESGRLAPVPGGAAIPGGPSA